MSLPTERTQIDSKGRVVIPIPFRKSLSMKAGDTIEQFLYKNSIVLRKLSPEPMKALCVGCGKTEDQVQFTHKTSDGRFGICKNCHSHGLSFKKVSPKP